MFDDGASEYTTSEDEHLAYGELPSFIEDNGSYDSEDVPLRPWHTHGLVTDPGIDWEEADKNDKEIRLLQFYNRGNTKFRFMAFPIEKAPPYIALSYTWGTDSPAQSVQIDGIQTPVRENLWEALSMIERKARHLWSAANLDSYNDGESWRSSLLDG